MLPRDTLKLVPGRRLILPVSQRAELGQTNGDIQKIQATPGLQEHV